MHALRDRYGRFVRIYTAAELRQRNVERMRARHRSDPETVRRWAREAQRRRRARLRGKRTTRNRCSICRSPVHNIRTCELLP